MKCLLIIIIVFISIGISAQSENDSIDIPIENEEEKTNKDVFVLDVNMNFWEGALDTFGLKNVSIGSNIYILKNFKLIDEHLYFAVGMGLGYNNMAGRIVPYVSPIAKTSSFKLLPDSINGEVLNYKKNKITTAHLDIPIELRFRTKPGQDGKSFKCTIGLKIGYMINSYRKYKGDYYGTDPAYQGETIKIKEYNIRNLEPFRYGALVRIGYGKFHLTGFYTFNKLYKENKGPDLRPITIGITYTPF